MLSGSHDDDYLLSPQFLRRLEQATVASRRILTGRTRGERRSARRGSSVEFADYRSYAAGDDLRYLDWKAYARLQRLFLKLFLEEEDLHVYVLVDGSASMRFGDPQKHHWAVHMAAALGYMVLWGGDRTQIWAYGNGQLHHTRVLRGRGCATEVFDWLGACEAGGRLALAEMVEQVLRVLPAPGLLFLISDLLTPDWEAALKRLAVARGELCVLQILAPEEMTPSLRGDLRLLDAEGAEPCELTMGEAVLRRYRRERDQFLEQVRQVCHHHGFAHQLCITDEAVEDVVLRSLRRLGVVR